MQMIPAYSPQARGAVGAELRDLAGAAAAGAAAGRDHDGGSGQPIPARALHRRVQRGSSRCGGARGHGVSRAAGGRIWTGSSRSRPSGWWPRTTRSRSRARLADGEEPVPAFVGGLHGDDPRTSGRDHLDPVWTSRGRPLRRKRGTPWKSGKPAQTAAFPLSHRDGDDGCLFPKTQKAGGSRRLKPKPDTSRVNKSGHLDLLTTAQRRPLAEAAQEHAFPFHPDLFVVAESSGMLVRHHSRPN